MKSSELMIGDYIMFDGCSCIIEEISSKGWLHMMYADSKVRVNLSSDFILDFIEGIPLTPEILEKNGFNKSVSPPGIHAKCYEYDNPKEKYNLTIADYNKYKRLLLNIDSEDSECFNIKCDYVHQLQHALRLCKIDKQIVV